MRPPFLSGVSVFNPHQASTEGPVCTQSGRFQTIHTPFGSLTPRAPCPPPGAAVNTAGGPQAREPKAAAAPGSKWPRTDHTPESNPDVREVKSQMRIRSRYRENGPAPVEASENPVRQTTSITRGSPSYAVSRVPLSFLRASERPGEHRGTSRPKTGTHTSHNAKIHPGTTPPPPPTRPRGPKTPRFTRGAPGDDGWTTGVAKEKAAPFPERPRLPTQRQSP